MAFGETIGHLIRRNSFLYKLRFTLLSQFDTRERVAALDYNVLNPAAEIPDYFFEINRKIFPAGQTNFNDLEQVETIARWMINNIQRGRGLGLASEETVKIMTLKKGGVCSDFAQVFNNLCVINGIKVREWGLKCLTEKKSIKGGHSFNEFYSDTLKKWVLIDTYKCIFLYKAGSSIPLSVFELFDTLRDGIAVTSGNIEPAYMTDLARVKEVYLSSYVVPFLISNYHNQTYDRYLKKFDFLPVFFTHGFIYLLGRSYKFLFIRELYYQPKLR